MLSLERGEGKPEYIQNYFALAKRGAILVPTFKPYISKLLKATGTNGIQTYLKTNAHEGSSTPILNFRLTAVVYSHVHVFMLVLVLAFMSMPQAVNIYVVPNVGLGTTTSCRNQVP